MIKSAKQFSISIDQYWAWGYLDFTTSRLSFESDMVMKPKIHIMIWHKVSWLKWFVSIGHESINWIYGPCESCISIISHFTIWDPLTAWILKRRFIWQWIFNMNYIRHCSVGTESKKLWSIIAKQIKSSFTTLGGLLPVPPGYLYYSMCKGTPCNIFLPPKFLIGVGSGKYPIYHISLLENQRDI